MSADNDTTALSINLNKIALIRNSRDTEYPSVTEHARRCIEAGADGITVHPRPDQRHIRADDCDALCELLAADFPYIEFNIEGNPFAPAAISTRRGVSDYPGFMALVERVRPAQCTLVPDSDAQLTSDHGFDLARDSEALRPIIEQLHAWDVRVSLFMDPIEAQIKLAQQIGADRIELYTGPYAEAFSKASDKASSKGQDSDGRDLEIVFQQFYRAAECAAEIGLGLNAGHDLNLHNLTRFATVPRLLEVSIGHAFTVDCIEMGLVNAVRAYQHCLGKAV